MKQISGTRSNFEISEYHYSILYEFLDRATVRYAMPANLVPMIPRIGEQVNIVGGEFKVKKISHSTFADDKTQEGRSEIHIYLEEILK
jgi:hypothetical protein